MLVKRKNLFKAIYEKGLDTAKTARLAGMSKSSVIRLITGQMNGSDSSWAKLVAIVGIDRTTLEVKSEGEAMELRRAEVRRPNLLKAMKKKGLTRAETSRLIGVDYSTLHQLLTGRNMGKVQTWNKLEDLLEEDQRTLRQIVNPAGA